MKIPVLKNSFKMKVEEDFVAVPMNSLEVSFDGTVETFTEMASGGFSDSLKTGMSISISFESIRDYGNAASDALWETAMLVGEDCNKEFEWELVDGSKYEFTAVVNVESIGGDSTGIETMSISLNVKGQPTFTEAPATGA